MTVQKTCSLTAVLFDYGGVLAEEGFREGLKAIGKSAGLDGDEFFEAAANAVYDTGYVLGKAKEAQYWEHLRQSAGIQGSDEDFRREILSRFVLRPEMIDLVRHVRAQVPLTAILSDQCNWLDELDERDDFFVEFHTVFNSYHLGKGKRDPSIFLDVVRELRINSSEALFIDDNEGHVARAVSQGLHGIVFRSFEDLVADLKQFGIEA